MGLRTVPDINEPVPVALDKADLDVLPDKPDGGLAVDDALEAVEVFRELRDLAGADFTGEYVA